jgi:ATP-binding cassette subfamily B protein
MVAGPLLAGLIGVWQRYLTTSTGESVMMDLRVRLFEHLQALPYSYFVHAKPGEAMSAVLNDVQGVGSVVSGPQPVQSVTSCRGHPAVESPMTPCRY